MAPVPASPLGPLAAGVRVAIHLQSKAWDLRKSSLEVVSGAKERRKSILVRGDPGLVLGRLEAWLAAWLAARDRS